MNVFDLLPDKLPTDKPDVTVLNDSNYITWRKAMRIYLNSKSLLSLVDTAPPVNFHAKWSRCDKWCFSAIFFACGKDAQENLEDYMTASLAWSTLADLYHSTSRGNLFRLSTAFHSPSQENRQSALAFINKVVSAASELRDLGEDVSDQKVKFQILGHLCPDFDSLVTTLSTVDTDDQPLSIKDIREAILREELTISRKKSRLPASTTTTIPPSNPATSAPTNNAAAAFPAVSPGRRPRCTSCSVRSHSAENCWHLHPEKAPPNWNRENPQRNRDNRDNSQQTSRRRDTSPQRQSTSREDRQPNSYRPRYRDDSRDHQNRNSRERYYRDNTPPRRRSRSRYRSKSPRHRSRSPSSRRRTEQSNKRSVSPKKERANFMITGIPCTPLSTPFTDRACMMRLTSNSAPSGWMLDSGASNHYTSNRDCFISFEPSNPIPVVTAGGTIYGHSRGDIVLNLTCGSIRITGVIYVPEMAKDTQLISIGQLESKGLEFTFKNGQCFVWKNGSLWAVATRSNNVYLLTELHNVANSAVISYPALQLHHVGNQSFPALTSPKEPRRIDTQLCEVWHRRMGHLNRRYVTTLPNVTEGVEIGTTASRKYSFDCVECVKSNQHRQISRMKIRSPSTILQIIYADICGPMQLPDFWGHRYFLLLVCAKSRFKWVYLLLKKDDCFVQFHKWRIWVERQFDARIKVFHTDGGGKFDSSTFNACYDHEGIEHVITPPYSPDMNGACEVWNRVIVHSASAMLHTAKMPITFWGQTVLCAVYLLNRSPTKGLHLKTPYEALYGQRPYRGHVRTWACRAYALIPKDSKKRKKWDSHSTECLLMGYYDSENVFKLYDISGNAIIKSRDVIFFEDILGHQNFQNDSLPLNKNIMGETPLPEPDDDVEDERVNPDEEHLTNLHEQYSHLLHDNESSSLPEQNAMMSLTCFPSIYPHIPNPSNVPRTYKSAMKSKNATSWKLACDSEYSALLQNSTWDLVPRLPTMTVINCKWVFDTKMSISSPPTIERYRARLVARGDSQTKGINFDEVYAPVVRFTSLRILLHIAALHDLEIDHGDFCNAFLNGFLSDTNIYMQQPEGYADDPTKVCHLKRSLYGLRQSARIWYQCLNTVLTTYGMQRVNSDQAIWIQREPLLLILAHVDDVLIIGSPSTVSKIKTAIADRYKFKDLGPVTKYTGFHIKRDRKNRRLFLSQSPYVSEILDEFAMSKCTPTSLPMDPKSSWNHLPSDTYLSQKEIKTYQRLIGRLMYLMIGSRPDIAYSVTKLAQFSSKPTLRHWNGALRILRYLRLYNDVSLVLGPTNAPTIVSPATNLIGYFDASLMDCPTTRKSTGGYIFFLHGSCISWSSKKQGLVALSSTEAEFIAGTEAARELTWILSFLTTLNIILGPTPHLIGDNQGALALAKNNDFRPRTKHIHARERYIAQMVDSGNVLLSYVPTKSMIADAPTKPLPSEAFKRHAISMGLMFHERPEHSCKVCDSCFDSRNALFRHMQSLNHYCDQSYSSPTNLYEPDDSEVLHRLHRIVSMLIHI